MALDAASEAGDDYGGLATGFPGSFVRRDELTEGDARAYEAVLAAAEDELAMQRFLEAHPRLLVQDLAGGNGGWVIPQARLGSEHVTDFLIAKKDYGGIAWYAVELERPQAKIFTKSGDPSAALTHALRQVADWRIWLSRNLDYATRPRLRSGLGLTGIDPQLEGLIIMGRERDLDQQESSARRQFLERAHHVRIRTYDWLSDQAGERITGKTQEADPGRLGRRGFLDYLADAVIAAPLHENPARDATEIAFDGIAWTWANPSAARKIEYEAVILPCGREPGDEIEVPLCIVNARLGGESLGLSDWKDWTSHVERDIAAKYSLLVTERTPAEGLAVSLSEDQDGVWRDPPPAIRSTGTEENPWLPRLDVLVHLPPGCDYAMKAGRLASARKIFQRQIALEQDWKAKREREAEARAASIPLTPGDTVSHDKFGIGRVVSVSGSGAHAEAQVDFGEELGVRLLALGYAPMAKL